MRHTSVARFTMLSFVAVLLLLLGVVVGCGGDEQEGEEGGGGGQEGEEGGEGAFITATPNPVPTGGGGEPGATTISWSTGSEASSGEVYLAPPADRPQEAERLFAGESTEGSQEAPWITEGGTYEFRLYAGNERATLLDTVTVTTSEQTQASTTQESTTKEKKQASNTEKESTQKERPMPLAASVGGGLSILPPTAVLVLLIVSAVLRRR